MKTYSTPTAALIVAFGLTLTVTDAQAAPPKKVGYAANRGARINEVLSGWPAADAGLEVGDIITYVNGVQISSTTHLMNALAGKSSVKLTVINSRDNSTVYVTAYPSGGKLGIKMEIVDVSTPPSDIYGSGKKKKG